MKRFTVLVTNRCNLACGTCMRAGSSDDDVDLDDARRLLPSLRALGFDHLALTGGEPLMHPRFADLLALCAEAGFTYNIVTNGWFAERYLELCEPFRKQVSHFAVSLDAHNAELHDANRRPGSFARAVASLERFRAAGYKVLVSHVLNRRNAGHLLDLLRFVERFETGVVLGSVIATGGNDDWTLTPTQRRWLQGLLPFVQRQYKDRVWPTTSLGAATGLSFCRNFTDMTDLALRFDGKLVFCCDALLDNDGAVLGDLRAEPFEDVLPRFGDLVGWLMRLRLRALAVARGGGTNTCDFCNHGLRERAAALARRATPALAAAS